MSKRIEDPEGRIILLKKNILNKLILTMRLPACILLTALAARLPLWVETVYSQRIFFVTNQLLSLITGIFPFSLAEILVTTTIIIILVSFIRFCIRLLKLKEKRIQAVVHFFFKSLVLISVIYIGFVFLWGLNYYRLSFANLAGLEVRQSSIGELEGLCRLLIERANNLRDRAQENSNGVMELRNGRDNAFKTAAAGFKNAAEYFPQLGGNYGRPKKVLLSELMSYAGITGVYFPFTGEANVNNTIPDYILPSTITHEMAHQRGFAREDEANYIAYVACKLHPNPDFQYSGTLLALTYSMNTLRRYDPDLAAVLREEYSEAVKRDLSDWSRFWQQYEGPIEEISEKVNDTYLKANRQKDGVYSYDRMVSLLLAEYRLMKSN